MLKQELIEERLIAKGHKITPIKPTKEMKKKNLYRSTIKITKLFIQTVVGLNNCANLDSTQVKSLQSNTSERNLVTRRGDNDWRNFKRVL